MDANPIPITTLIFDTTLTLTLTLTVTRTNAKTLSREHATLSWNDTAKRFEINALGKSGVYVGAQRHDDHP